MYSLSSPMRWPVSRIVSTHSPLQLSRIPSERRNACQRVGAPLKMPDAMEPLTLSLTTPAGDVRAQIDVPAGFVPVTAIVPLLHRLSEEAMRLEERRAADARRAVSCRRGCAACCRLLVPVSAPEAFALREMIDALPSDQQARIKTRVDEARHTLSEAGVLDALEDVAESERQLTDGDLDAINRAYYALRLPCPFLEDEVCSIYESRPAACRELLVTSPADLCRDIERNPVAALPVPLRMSTILSQAWAEVQGEPARLIALPLALAWAERHAGQAGHTRTGPAWLDAALDAASRYLSHEFASRAPEDVNRES
jgi:Fe-S-cluster containining protein